MKIYLVRHGFTQSNRARTDFIDDPKLDKSGFNVLVNTRRTLEKYNIDKVYTSNLKDATQTADMLGYHQYEVDERLNELDFGEYSGQLLEEIQDHYEGVLESEDDIFNLKYPGEESRNDLIKRTSEFLDDLVEKGEDALCISHGLAIKAALFWILKDRSSWDNFWIENGSVTIFEIHDDKKYIKGVNII